MSEDSPKSKISFNPTVAQWWFWLGSKAIAITVGLFFGIQWVAGITFRDELRNFHDEVKPVLLEEFDHRIEVHKLEASTPFLERIHEIESHNMAVDEKLGAMKETQEQVQGQLNRMDDKLDRILVNGDHS